jgi:hypothetical protein
MLGVGLVFSVVLFLLQSVSLELFNARLTFTSQLVILLRYSFCLDLRQRNKVELCISLDLQRELSVQFRQSNDVVRFLVVKTIFHDEFLELGHFVVDPHRKRTVQVHHLLDKIKQLILHLLDVARTTCHPCYLIYDVLILFYW